ncbi:MAG TPA: DNA translocase FtsK 4TM domain-containing protein [Candidatus Paceibacterota bacterium]|nr:DNA translocase FtsK 4TM domain-containing protein [Candidatus Paceibacterota bacterium]
MVKSTTAKKKPRSRRAEEVAPQEPMLRPETIQGAIGILLLAVAIFLVLAGFKVGGSFGAEIVTGLTYLVGVGYALVPLSVAIAATMLFLSHERRIGVLKWASSLVFFLASLGIIAIAFPDRGGVIGRAITQPLMSAIATPATVTFLLAFIVISILVAFDMHPYAVTAAVRERMRERALARAEHEEDVMDEELDLPPVTEPEEPEEDEAADEEDEADAPAAKDSILSRMLPKKGEDDEGEIPIQMLTPGDAYVPPPISLLGKNKGKPEVGDVKANANIIKRTLLNFGIQVEMDEVAIGPTVTRYAMKPAEGVRLSKILALQSNLELALAASPVRIEAPIPGKALVGIEVPNSSRTTLGLSPLMSDTSFTQSDKPLLVALGRSITGVPHYADLARMPHMLIAGATGAGKSVTIHDLIVSLLYRCGPDQLRFVMVDPKRVELTLYNSIPHLLTPVITDAKKAILALKWLAKEMDRRYDVLEGEKVRDIASYHNTVLKPALEKAGRDPEAELPEPMPYIVVVIDELADIMQTYPRELEAGIVRLAQMSRAVGIHLLLSTQRPSVKVITGLIKANVPARLALQVASQIDSRTILDMGGAEKLLGAGDMLFLSGDMSKPTRIQAPYVSESEVKSVAKYLADAYVDRLPSEIDFSGGSVENGGPDAIFAGQIDDDDEDDLYAEARQAVIEAGKASTSYLQRKLRVGYARAARLMDILEERGVIGPADGAKPREVLEGAGGGGDDSSYDEEEGTED